ncbi:MAG TPA: hypothetical protein VF796_11505 [Humisphaera sp.]
MNEGREQPGLTGPVASIGRRIAEAAAWCGRRVDAGNPRDSTRSPELRPAALLVAERRKPDGTREHIMLTGDDRRAAVDGVVRRRSELLAATAPVVPPARTGRVLAFELENSLWEGLSEDCSKGLVDGYDVPGWDTWVGLGTWGGHEVLYCWVPAPLVPLAEQAIVVNSTACLRWAEDDELTGLGLAAT